MSNSGLSPEAHIGGMEPLQIKTHVFSAHRRVLTNLFSSRMLQPSTEMVVANFSMSSDLLLEG